jgi:apolipoprotein N-acyltransferase
MNDTELKPLNGWQAVLLMMGAAGCFHAAYTPAQSGLLALLIVGYVGCLVQLARMRTTRLAFYAGLLTGLACFGPQLAFFWNIFGAAAIALWVVLAFWIALFAALTHIALMRFGAKRAVWLVPFLWTGLEYFRSELYYLKFAWLNVGLAFGLVQPIGVYGAGFVVAAFAAIVGYARLKLVDMLVFIALCGILAGLFLPLLSFDLHNRSVRPTLVTAGVQLDFPTPSEIHQSLNKVINEPLTNKRGLRQVTNVDLIVLPEYTLDGEPTAQLKEWCRTNKKFLIVGGKEAASEKNYYNTAFVIGTNGEVVFKQTKSVPIQFFKDGLPAPEQRVWESPWGKIGICICYDLSYTRVTDELVRQGAQMLIVPTMDVADWGRHQHELHARVAPVRAAEYGVPIFRVASSGISQGVTASGSVRASAPFPGDGEMIFFATRLGRAGSLPLDRLLAPLCAGVTGLFVAWLAVGSIRRFRG